MEPARKSSSTRLDDSSSYDSYEDSCSYETGNSDLFNSLSKDVLKLIFLNINAKDMLQVCFVNRACAHVCRDKDLYTKLLTLHYPSLYLTNNPKQQYIAIITGVKTIYKMVFLHDNCILYRNGEPMFKQPVKVGRSRRPESSFYWSIQHVSIQTLHALLSVPSFKAWLSCNFLNDGVSINELDRVCKQIFSDDSCSCIEDVTFKDTVGNSCLFVDYFDRIFKEFVVQVFRRSSFLSDIFYLSVEARNNYISCVEKTLEEGDSFNSAIESSLDFLIKIDGNPIPTGEVGWIWVFREDHDLHLEGHYNDHLVVFKSKEALANKFVIEHYEDFFNSVLEEGFEEYFQEYMEDNDIDEEEDVLNGKKLENISKSELRDLEIFNDCLRQLKCPLIPFTEENMFKHVMSHNEFVCLEHYVDEEEGEMPHCSFFDITF